MIKIKIAENGPYLLSGVSSITRMLDGKRYEVDGLVALCRCGKSKNKPFCDGTHKSVGFSGEKGAERRSDKLDLYPDNDLTIRDNRGLCAHAGRCTNGLPQVFRLRKEPFVDPVAASTEEITAVIRECPSGALSYELAGTEYTVTGGDSTIGFAPNGPYAVRGGAELEGAELLEGGTTDHMTLCRCGQSQNKPFCDGAHWNVQFDEDAEPKS